MEALGGCTAAMTGTVDGDCALDAVDFSPCEQVLRHLGAGPGRLARLQQVHGDRIVAVTAADCRADVSMILGDGDALVTATPGILLGISIADCIPVYVVAPGRAAGLAHAGRAGTRLRIAAKLVRTMSRGYGVSTDTMHAFVGPGAGPCCYEVSASIAGSWQDAGLPAVGRHLDLWAANRAALLEAGVPAKQVMTAGHCTICQPGFHSFRRDQGRARNLALLGLQ